MIDKKHIVRLFRHILSKLKKDACVFSPKQLAKPTLCILMKISAQAAGYPSLLVPLTFLFSLDLERPNPFQWLSELNLSLGRILHGSQSFCLSYPELCG
jgi:hypothetical protein